MFLSNIARLAGRGAESLNKNARGRVRSFLLSLRRSDGGFAGTESASYGDVYYSPFAAMALSALGVVPDLNAAAKFAERRVLAAKSAGETLDLAQLASAARLIALAAEIPRRASESASNGHLADAICEYRSDDCGFSHFAKHSERSTPYGLFLALNALAELGRVSDDFTMSAETALHSLMPDGSFRNDSTKQSGSLNATAAAVAVLAEFGAPLSASCKNPGWRDKSANFILSSQFSKGGFKACDEAPLPDILSTSAALTTLSLLNVDLSAEERKTHREFIADQWRSVTGNNLSAGFAGTIASDTPDAEYTFHALIALALLAD